MSSWNVVWVRERTFELMNKSSTLIHLSPSSQVDVSLLMSRMEDLGVPVAYTEELREIRFTKLRDMGDYKDCVIRMSSNRRTRESMDRVFVHELAHHVEETYDTCSNESIHAEKRSSAKHLPDGYAKKNVFEYFAVGFEVYYCGTREERKKMKTKNPILYRTIHEIHRNFRRP